jgi:hypothetical protein
MYPKAVEFQIDYRRTNDAGIGEQKVSSLTLVLMCAGTVVSVSWPIPVVVGFGAQDLGNFLAV